MITVADGVGAGDRAAAVSGSVIPEIAFVAEGAFVADTAFSATIHAPHRSGNHVLE
jgi:hypothetical protein